MLLAVALLGWPHPAHAFGPVEPGNVVQASIYCLEEEAANTINELLGQDKYDQAEAALQVYLMFDVCISDPGVLLTLQERGKVHGVREIWRAAREDGTVVYLAHNTDY